MYQCDLLSLLEEVVSRGQFAVTMLADAFEAHRDNPMSLALAGHDPE